jgi:hypothetical protein
MAIVMKRRSLLRAAGGVAMALPMLELTRSAQVHAGGGAPPKRYVFVYCGLSTGRDGAGQLIVPDAPGPGYDLKRSLMPLGGDALPYGGNGFSVQDEVSIVTGLTIPWADAAGQAPPPGGKSPEFHYNTVGPIVSGVSGGPQRNTPPNGPSSDNLVAAFLSPGIDPLTYRVQPEKYVGAGDAGGHAGRISWKDEGGGNIVGVDPFASPRLAYTSLFGNFEPPDPALAAEAAFLLARRRSVLDMLRSRTQGLLGRMGGQDKIRMQRHFDELKALEDKLDSMPPPTTGACELLPDPGEDPLIGQPHGTTAEGNLDYNPTAAYSNEDLRAELMMDYVRMSFACDMARVAAVRLTIDQTFLNMLPLSGAESDMHELSHGAVSDDAHADAVGWHIKHFARLVSMLRDTQELDGSSLLDHTALVLCFEGGYGFDPESNEDGHAHSTENMVALVAGHAGGLVHGSHIVANGMHPSNVIISAMQAVGMDTDTLGEISGTIPGLLP